MLLKDIKELQATAVAHWTPLIQQILASRPCCSVIALTLV
jgi:hypothetical protein